MIEEENKMEIPDSMAPRVISMLQSDIVKLELALNEANKQVELMGLEIVKLKEKAKAERKPREKKHK